MNIATKAKFRPNLSGLVINPPNNAPNIEDNTHVQYETILAVFNQEKFKILLV